MHIICYGIICILFVGRLTFAQPRICQSLEQAWAGRGKFLEKNIDKYLEILKIRNQVRAGQFLEKKHRHIFRNIKELEIRARLV